MVDRLSALAAPAGVVLLGVLLAGCSALPQRAPGMRELDSPSASASGSAAARPSPGASSGAGAGVSAAPSSAPSVSIAPVALPDVRGYRYNSSPRAIVTGFQQLAATRPGVFSAPTVRDVRRADLGATAPVICSVALYGLNPEFVGQPEVEKGLVTGLVRGMSSGKGYTVKQTSVAGQPVVLATSKSSTITAWYRGGSVTMLVSAVEPEISLAYAKALIARQPA